MRTILLIFFFVITTATSLAQCWITIATGPTHSLGIKSNGTLWAWGENSFGQLGDGNFIDKNIPI